MADAHAQPESNLKIQCVLQWAATFTKQWIYELIIVREVCKAAISLSLIL